MSCCNYCSIKLKPKPVLYIHDKSYMELTQKGKLLLVISLDRMQIKEDFQFVLLGKAYEFS